MNIKSNEQYPFKYETHAHTKQGSACARKTGAQMAIAYEKAGYTGIFITDHFYHGNTSVSRRLPWNKWVDKFCKGYEDAKRVGDEIGLQVFFAWEAGYKGTDFLVYGLDKQWLLEHPEIRDATVEEQFKLVHESGGMVIHAHPYREEFYIRKIRLYPEYVDGVEAVNASHSNINSKAHFNPMYDKLAVEYAKKHNLPITAGSDSHHVKLLGGGMAFKRKFYSVSDYIEAIKTKEDCLLLTGNEK